MTRTIELDGEFGFFAEEINDPIANRVLPMELLILPPCDPQARPKTLFCAGQILPQVPRAL
jgi:hypothetical protein